jgi:hypothetical protein
MPSETSQHLPAPVAEGSDAPSAGPALPYENREAQEFAVREGLEGPLAAAMRLVPEHFHVVGPLVVSLEDWIECPQDWSLVITAPVSGDPIEVSRANWGYVVAARALLGAAFDRLILSPVIH